MSLPFSRPAAARPAGTRRDEYAFRLNPIWLAAGLAMVALAACTFFLVPEQSFAVAAGLLIVLISAADLRTGFLAFVVLYAFMPVSWGIDVASWMPYLTARRLCCICLALTFVPHWQHAFDTPRVRRVGWIILGLISLQLVVGLVSSDPLSAAKRAFGDVTECYLPLLMAAHLFRTKAQMRSLLTVACVTMAIICVLGIIEHTIDYNFYDSFRATRDDINILLTEKTQMTRGIDDPARRVRVAFDHSIILGLHIMCILLACVYLFRQKGTFRILFLVAGLPIFCMAMFFTYSRGPMLGLACGVVWLGLIGRGTRLILLALLLVCLVTYQLLPAKARSIMAETVTTTTDMQSGVSVGGGTARARVFMFQKGLEFSQQSLLLGHGPAEVRHTKMRVNTNAVLNFETVDNFYLLVLLDYGVIVLLCTVLFFAYLLGMFTRAALRIADRDMALLAAVGAAICVANYAAMTTMSVSITLFWILLGPALRACDLYQPEVRRRGRKGNLTMRISVPDKHRDSSLLSPAGDSRILSRSFSSLRVPMALPQARLFRTGLAAMGLAGLALVGASSTHAATSFYGTTGLFASPTAAVPERGTWSLGSNYVGRDFRPGASMVAKGTVANYFTLTMLPRVEFTVVLTNYQGKIGTTNLNHGLTPDYSQGGYTLDRTFSAQWLALTQRGSRPAIAFGARDIFGRTVKHLSAQYGVMSFNRGRLTLSAGLGTKALHGPFGGVEFALTPHVSAIAEALYGQTNGGIRLVPLKNFQLDGALMGFRSLGGGLSYRRRF